MNKTPTIFISYNPKAPQEETLAVRLQTIGAVNGFQTLLPDRFAGKSYVDDETERRIISSDYFVIFATRSLSKIVQDEIDVAFGHFKDRSKIIVIYNHDTVDLASEGVQDFTPIPFDPRTETVDLVIKKVINRISQKEEDKKQKQNQNGLLALLGIGLGLLALSALFGNDDE